MKVRHLLPAALLLLAINVFGQDAELLERHGQMLGYSGKPGAADVYDNHALNPGFVSPMRPVLQQICTQIENTGPMNRLIGYNLRRRLDIDRPNSYNIPADKATLGSVWVAMFHFVRDQGKIIQNGETAAGVMVDINSLYALAPDDQLFGQSCSELRLPHLFTASYLKLQDTGQGYYEMTDRDNYTRVYTNGRPLFIPYTREQLLTFYTRFYNWQAAKLKDNIAGTQKQIAANLISPQTGKPFTAAEKNGSSYQITVMTNKGLQESIGQLGQQLETYNRLIAQYQRQLNALSPAQRQAPAYISLQQTDESGLFGPAEEGSDGAVAAMTINPNYFNPALPRTAVQLLTVKFYGLDRNSDFILSRRLTEVYDQFDFKPLQQLVK